MSAVDKTDQGGVRRCQKNGAVLNGGGGEVRKTKFVQWPEEGKKVRMIHINTWNKSILGRNQDAEAGAWLLY